MTATTDFTQYTDDVLTSAEARIRGHLYALADGPVDQQHGMFFDLQLGLHRQFVDELNRRGRHLSHFPV